MCTCQNSLYEFISIIIVISGWIIGYYLTIRKSRIDKKRDISVENLIRIYRIICDKLHRENEYELYKAFETIATDLQLFGTKKQIKITKNIIESFANDKTTDLEELLNDIRNHLRKELYLEKLESNNHIRYLRTKPHAGNKIKK